MSQTPIDEGDTAVESGESDSDIDLPTEQSVPNHRWDAVITLAFIALSGVFLVLSESFAGIKISEFDPGAAAWPRAILAVIIVASLVNLRNVYVRAKADGEVSKLFSRPEIDLDGALDVGSDDRKFILTIVLFTVYLLAIEPMGFLSSTPFYLLAMAWMLGYRGKPIRLVAFSALTALVFYVLFVNMNIALPSGTGPFRELSVFVENYFSFSL